MSSDDSKSKSEPCRYCPMDHGEEGEIPSEPGLAALHDFVRTMTLSYGIPLRFTGAAISEKQSVLLNKLCDVLCSERNFHLAEE